MFQGSIIEKYNPSISFSIPNIPTNDDLVYFDFEIDSNINKMMIYCLN